MLKKYELNEPFNPSEFRKVYNELLDAVKPAYGQLILSVSGGPVTINSVANTGYTLINIFDTKIDNYDKAADEGILATLGTLHSLKVTKTGIYKLEFNTAFTSTQASELFTIRPHIDGVASEVEIDVEAPVGADTESVSLTALLELRKGQSVDIRITLDGITADVTFVSAIFNMLKVDA